MKLPQKRKGHLVKDTNQKLGRVKNSLQGEFSPEEFNEKFKTMFPVEFDIYSFEKRNEFDKWVSNVLSSSPKK
ncbi:hypothetical protein [Psychromonas sp. SP041]|uniref:hypothetical protein n=1 Tax=Psychromonas sp. SP041 TaxID=1365007 RepID=UPI0010C7A8ED|nr:hypothetical protein [Psychromonas sp. SP041]